MLASGKIRKPLTAMRFSIWQKYLPLKLLIFSLFLPTSALANTNLVNTNSVDPSSIGLNSVAKNSPCNGVSGRPCIALVLAGGGARGSAHVGVLKVIEELGIPVDVAIGTSMGSFVAGLFATGKSAAEIEQLFLTANWEAGYNDDLPRSNIPNRRKRHNDRFPIQLGIGLDAEGFKLPKGIIQGQGMKRLIDSMLGSYAQLSSFNELPIPFRAVAADLETGEQVVLDHGDLATAMQVSMSLPGILRPIEVDGRVLVDGGIANNLPISVAKSLGADIVIAVDIGTPPKKHSDIETSFDVLDQLSNFLTQANQNRERALISDRDILIRPHLDDLSLIDFDQLDAGIQAGYEAAIASLSNRNALSMNLVNREVASASSGEISAVRIVNLSRLGDDYILHRMQLKKSPPYSQEQIQQGIERLYGQGTIARVSTLDEIESGERITTVIVEENEWGPGYLDFEFSFEDNFKSFSRFEIGAAWRYTNLSPYGAEWINSIEFGTEKALKTQIYWPLWTSDFFLSGESEFRREISTFTENDRSLGDYILTAHTTNAGIGYEFGDRFDTRLRVLTENGEVELPDILQARLNLSEFDFNRDSLILSANYDTLDESDFARGGWRISAELRRNRNKVFNAIEYVNQMEIDLTFAHSFGSHTIKPTLKAGNVFSDTPVSLSNFDLGGFLSLSGNDRDFISGQFLRFARLVYTYRLARNLIGGTELPFYLGLSYEAGNVWNEKSAISWDNAIQSGAIFLGWDSPIGPAFIAYGHSDTGNESVYISLGKRF